MMIARRDKRCSNNTILIYTFSLVHTTRLDTVRQRIWFLRITDQVGTQPMTVERKWRRQPKSRHPDSIVEIRIDSSVDVWMTPKMRKSRRRPTRPHFTPRLLYTRKTAPTRSPSILTAPFSHRLGSRSMKCSLRTFGVVRSVVSKA